VPPSFFSLTTSTKCFSPFFPPALQGPRRAVGALFPCWLPDRAAFLRLPKGRLPPLFPPPPPFFFPPRNNKLGDPTYSAILSFFSCPPKRFYSLPIKCQRTSSLSFPPHTGSKGRMPDFPSHAGAGFAVFALRGTDTPPFFSPWRKRGNEALHRDPHWPTNGFLKEVDPSLSFSPPSKTHSPPFSSRSERFFFFLSVGMTPNLFCLHRGVKEFFSAAQDGSDFSPPFPLPGR